MADQQPPRPSQFYDVPHPPAYVDAMARFMAERAAKQAAGKREAVEQIEAQYAHLPPLPPRLATPLYAQQPNQPGYSTDDFLMALYEACAEGDLAAVCAFAEESNPGPTPADLSYALEEACQNLQPEVVRFLLTQPEVKLHSRCFRRCIEHPDDDLITHFDQPRRRGSSVSQSIFTSGSPNLLALLRVLRDAGWHPNQLIGPPQRGKRPPLFRPCQEVALHYPRCILDEEVLQFLLDAGADPTIARELHPVLWLESVTEQPTRRLSGDILEMAVNIARPLVAARLISHGAKPEYGIPLHSLVRRRPDPATFDAVPMNQDFINQLYRSPPELEYPTLNTRYATASQLIDAGEDINRVANVYVISGLSDSRLYTGHVLTWQYRYDLPEVGPWAAMPTLEHNATPLSHAKNSLDWGFVSWLLRNGADPAADPIETSFPEAAIIYSNRVTGEELETYEGMVRLAQQMSS